MKLNTEDLKIHSRTKELCRQIRRDEAELVNLLQIVERRRIHKNLGFTSLFKYAVLELGMSEASAYSFISVAKAATKFDGLRDAIQQQELSVHKASRMMAVINHKNAAELLVAAKTMTSRNFERHLAKYRDGKRQRDSIQFVAPDVVRLSVSVSDEILKKIERVQQLMKTSASIEQTLDHVLSEYIERNDPLKKADRAIDSRRKAAKKPEGRPNLQNSRPNFCARRKFSTRKPIPAFIKHQVHLRDACQCTHIDGQGRRCENRKWLQIHHIQPVSQGGSNDLKNLTILCSAHHDLVHQLSMPIEGQVTWLREPRWSYRA